MLADCRFARQHAGVGPVENCIGHVGGFGPGGDAGVRHAVEHLGGDDHRLAPLVAEGDDPFLGNGHLGDVDLDAQIAVRDHDRVGRLDDLLEPVERLGFLDLGDHLRLPALIFDQGLQLVDLGGVADKAQAEKIDTAAGGPDGVVAIGLAQGRR